MAKTANSGWEIETHLKPLLKLKLSENRAMSAFLCAGIQLSAPGTYSNVNSVLDSDTTV